MSKKDAPPRVQARTTLKQALAENCRKYGHRFVGEDWREKNRRGNVLLKGTEALRQQAAKRGHEFIVLPKVQKIQR